MKIALLILNYNGKRHLDAFFASAAFLQGHPQVEAIVVDNASCDGSIQHLRARYPWVRVVVNEENYGWGEGYNQGIAALRQAGLSYTHYLFINNDVFPTEEWLSCYLAAVAAAGPEVGEIGCRAVFAAPFVAEQPLLVESPEVRGCHAGVFLLSNRDYSLQTRSRRQGGALSLEVRMRPELGTLPPYLQHLLAAGQPPPLAWYLLQVRNVGSATARLVAPVADLRLQLQTVNAVPPGAPKIGVLAHQSRLPAGTRSLALSPGDNVLLARLIHDPADLRELIQNSGIGLNRAFQGYDLHCFDPVATPQEQRTLVGVCGVAKLVPAEYFHKINGFDPNYFMYYEDVDFSLRLRQLGLRPIIAAAAILRHTHSGSSQAGSPFFRRQVARSLYYFHHRHGSLWRRTMTWMSFRRQAAREVQREVYEGAAPYLSARRRFATEVDKTYIMRKDR